MYRKISDYLKVWKESPYRKPLILQGARQVGKTYSILEFASSNYDNIAYFNFETSKLLNETFEESLDPDQLIPMLSRIAGISIIAGRTLIVFDEIQCSERALTSLKYFYEQAPDHHVIAAGSLLGVAMNRKQYSFPVGKVDIATMHPMDFEEFLLAFGEKELASEIRGRFVDGSPLPAVLHSTALRYYREYLVVGGMPDCVVKYADKKDLVLVRHIQDTILEGYLNDMSKYSNEHEVGKTRLTYNSITVQLSRKNAKFQYKLVKKGGRAAEFEKAIEWLILSGIVTRINYIEKPVKPLDNNKDIDSFKIYMSDVGLLCAKNLVAPVNVIYDDGELDDFKGALVENYVCNQLSSNGYISYCWKSKREAEVDFIIQKGNDVIPIEVKSSVNTRSRSLSVYMESYGPKYAIRLSTRNFGQEGSMRCIPLYAAFCI